MSLSVASATGPADDFGHALAALRPTLVRRARHLARDPAAAEDLVQETLLRALAARHGFQLGSHLERWTARILWNRFVDERRRRTGRRVPLPANLAAPVSLPDADEPGPLDLISSGDLAAALGSLRAAHRQVFTLAHVDQLDHSEIARRLGIARATVATRLYRARRALRQVLERDLSRAIRASAEKLPLLGSVSSS
jgi:RNA polymerase sigma-70 factor (ECF subfamily)